MDRRSSTGTFARAVALAFVATAAAACGHGPVTSSEYNNSGRDVALALNSGVPSTYDDHSVPWSQLAREQQAANAQDGASASAQAAGAAPNAQPAAVAPSTQAAPPKANG